MEEGDYVEGFALGGLVWGFGGGWAGTYEAEHVGGVWGDWGWW